MNVYRIFYIAPKHFGCLASRMVKFTPNPIHYDTVTVLEKESLGAVWEETSYANGKGVTESTRLRSMMIGDVVLDVTAGKAFVCSMMGWTELSSELFRAFMVKPSKATLEIPL